MAMKYPNTSTPENHVPLTVGQAVKLRLSLANVHANLDHLDFMALVNSTIYLQGAAVTKLNYKLITTMKNQVLDIVNTFTNRMKKVGYDTDKMIVKSRNYPAVDNVYFSMFGIKLFKQYVCKHQDIQKEIRKTRIEFTKILNANYPYFFMQQTN